MSKVPVIFVMGPPGAGKSTVCQELEKNYDVVHLCVGNLLRNEQKKDTPTGKTIDSYMRTYHLVPAELTCALLKQVIQEKSRPSHGFIIDGFPLDGNNWGCWQKEMADLTTLSFVLHFSAPIELCVQRCLERSRNDDSEDIISKRMAVFSDRCLPLVNQFEQMKLLYTIDCTKDKTEVYSIVAKILADVNIVPKKHNLDETSCIP